MINLFRGILKKIQNLKPYYSFMEMQENLIIEFINLNELSKLNINYLIIAYRGFSGNTGSPSENGLYEDANSAKVWLNKNGVKDKDIIIYGESLGTALRLI